jgi:hypothetical protein
MLKSTGFELHLTTIQFKAMCHLAKELAPDDGMQRVSKR